MKFCFEYSTNLNELDNLYFPRNLRASGFMMISGGIELITKFFKFAYLKGINFALSVNVELIFVIQGS